MTAATGRAATDPAVAAWVQRMLDDAPPLDDDTAQRISAALFGGAR